MAKSPPKSAEDIFLSIVIPSYNSKKWISHCLASLQHQVERRDVEVIVVDSSEDDLSGFIGDKFPFVQTYHLKARAYPGTARTFGISKSSGSVIAFIDTDCEAGADWVDKMIEAQQNGVNVVGGPVANGTPDSWVGTAEYLLEFSELVPAMPEGKVRFIPTCNISFKRKVYDKIGKIEDTIKGSDALFCRKITLLGESIHFRRDLPVWHSNRTLLRKYLRNQYDIGFGGALVRKLENQKGAILVKAPFLIPLIPAARTLLIGQRFLKHDKKLFLQFLKVYPLVLLGMFAYTKGFWDGRKSSVG